MIFTTLKTTKKPSNKLRSAVFFLYKYYIPGIAWGVFVTYLSLSASSSFSRFEFNFIVPGDKIVHFFLYFTWFFIICRQIKSINHYRRISTKACILTGLCLINYGILMELLQKFLTNDRQFSWTDILSNTAGIVMASVLSGIFSRKFKWF